MRDVLVIAIKALARLGVRADPRETRDGRLHFFYFF